MLDAIFVPNLLALRSNYYIYIYLESQLGNVSLFVFTDLDTLAQLGHAVLDLHLAHLLHKWCQAVVNRI